jgi:hypothetical protein
MANERLRSSMTTAGLTVHDLAGKVQVDPKTVERWVTTGRLPHRTHRQQLSRLLSCDENYLWPDLLDDPRTHAASRAELVALYPNRGQVPRDLWRSLADQAEQAVDVLAYAALFLTDAHPDLPALLAGKAASGVKIRLVLGDPNCCAVTVRGQEEGIEAGLAARVELSRRYLAPALDAPGVELRVHSTTLYNSLYRYDGHLLVNTHAYGAPAAQSPVLYVRRVPEGRLFDHYVSSFERVWQTARPWQAASACVPA